MNKFDLGISKWDFKKIAKIYLIILLTAAIGCAAAACAVYRDRISFAWQYSRVSEAAEEKDVSSIQTRLDSLASFPDVVDILVLDSGNNVVYSAKNSRFGSGRFDLSRSGDDKNYFVSSTDSSVVFRYVKNDDFMLDSVFNKDFGSIRDEYNDENFYVTNFSSKTVYMLSFISERADGGKIYFISSPTSVAGGAVTVKIISAIIMLLFMAYWVLLALWAYQNALKARLSALLWGIVVLLTNLAGVIVYQIYKHANATCPECGASQSKLHIYCTSCGTKLGEKCPACGAQIGRNDMFCPNCGKASPRD